MMIVRPGARKEKTPANAPLPRAFQAPSRPFIRARGSVPGKPLPSMGQGVTGKTAGVWRTKPEATSRGLADCGYIPFYPGTAELIRKTVAVEAAPDVLDFPRSRIRRDSARNLTARRPKSGG